MKYYRVEIFPLDKSYEKDNDWDIFQDIYYRAYKIISQYEPKVINKQAEITRNYLFTVNTLAKSNDIRLTTQIPDENLRGIFNLSNAYLIKHSYTCFKSDKYQIAQWDLFFALIALYEIDTCMLIQSTINSGRITYPNYHKRENYHVYALRALEAVIFAENSKSFAEEIEEKVKETKSKQAKKAALKKHQKTHQTYYRFIKFYNDGDFISKSSAARAFLKLVEGEDIGLVPTNAKRSLLDALRDHEKGLRNFK